MTFNDNSWYEAQSKYFSTHQIVKIFPLGCLLSCQVMLGTDGIFTVQLFGLDAQHDRVLARWLESHEVGGVKIVRLNVESFITVVGVRDHEKYEINARRDC